MNNYTGTDNLLVMADANNYNKYLLSLVLYQAKKNEHIVDFGAGIGTFARELSRKGYQVHCIEPDPKQADIIRDAGLPVTTSLAEIEDCSIDYLYTLNVLEHIADDLMMLRQWHQKLKPGGKILVYVPAFQMLYSSMDRKVGHFRRYTKQTLTKKLVEAQFHDMEGSYVDSLGFFATLLFKYIGDDTGALNRRALIFYDRIIFPCSKIFDYLLNSFFGKNVFMVATK